ncbi:MAG: hypothetical protein U9R56_07590 [candidate division Zixibacteria bacterium]|nr:hypothetical protein [candidate division Zixibacteria bacterium]
MAISIVKMSVVIAVCLPIVLVVSCNNGSADSVAVDRHRKLAGELRDNKLYRSAIEEYKAILSLDVPDIKTRANVNYLIGRVYYENLQNYEQAAAYYVRARALDPEGSFVDEASKKLVASLEKMGHMLDAKRQLDDVTDIDASPRKKGDVVVAKIGGVPIWLSEIEEQIQAMPLEVQKQFTNQKARINFVHQYVAVELIYHAAVREDYGNDPEIQEQERLLHKKLLVDKYVLDNVMPQVKIDTSDVRNFYVARKDDYYNGVPYDSVKAQVFLDYQNEKMETAFSDYIPKLAKVEKVEFFDNKVR